MKFVEANDYDGSTNYDAPLPAKYRNLLIAGSIHQFAKGSWGSYLTLSLKMEAFIFWLHYFFRKRPGTMFGKAPQTIYALHHLLEGRSFGILSNGLPVELSSDWSNFFIIPGGMQQSVTMEAGTTISMHIDFNRSYLDNHIEHYKVLQPLFSQYDADPGQALHEKSVIHDYQLEYPWRKLHETLPTTANPVLYLDVHGRELLRMHYERLEEVVFFQENKVDSAKVTVELVRKVFDVKQILEKDITLTHSIHELSRDVNLNVFDLKRGFKEVYKTTIHQYLMELRMQFAREQVLTTALSNRQIALLCGIRNLSHFCTMFKTRFKLSPRKMRIEKGGKLLGVFVMIKLMKYYLDYLSPALQIAGVRD